MTSLVFCLLALAGLWLLLRFNSLWVYRLLDHALRNDRRALSSGYELPRYLRLGRRGEADTGVRWPGWDGWYFFVIPAADGSPVKMIRASVMTGLYGLDGIDNYRLLAGLSPFAAIEQLILISSGGSMLEESGSGGSEVQPQENYLAHRYLPKSNLKLNPRELDVTVFGPRLLGEPNAAVYGSVRGKWPEYRFEFLDPEGEFKIHLDYRGEKLVWWADVPAFFAYFSAFGEFSGTLACRCRAEPIAAATQEKESATYPIRGAGGFEHGFARKPFNFDRLYSPVRALRRILPGFRPVRYHYEVLIGDGDLRGGWMHARSFGINFRNRGGVYLGEDYLPIQSVEIDYLEDGADRIFSPGFERSPMIFYRQWKVRAKTSKGSLEYIARREGLPPPVAGNMTYYTLSFEGAYRKRKIRGKGYGEYLSI